MWPDVITMYGLTYGAVLLGPQTRKRCDDLNKQTHLQSVFCNCLNVLNVYCATEIIITIPLVLV